jgi:SpoVK/Ycf46/Vps4 family AAA+-type ATPase
MSAHTPCIALIEDVDNVFHGRDNVTPMAMPWPTGGVDKDDKDRQPFARVTFDCLLNCIDGVDSPEGVFLVITTNKVEHVDEALGRPAAHGGLISTRPGRIDKAVELGYMTPECKRRMAEKVLAGYPDEIDRVLEHVCEPATPAQWQERCAQLALKRLWEKAT